MIHTKIESTNAMPVLREIALFNREHLLADGKFGHYRVWGMPLVRLPFHAGHHQCARSTASTVVIPAIIEPAIAIAAGTPRGSARLTTPAMNIAAAGSAITK